MLTPSSSYSITTIMVSDQMADRNLDHTSEWLDLG